METNAETKIKKGSKLSRALDWIGIIWMIILTPILIIEGVLMFKSIAYPDQLPDFMGYIPLVVDTNSMSPTFDGLDVLIVQQPEDATALEEGEIISFLTSKKMLVTHRIIAVEDDPTGTVLYTTQGDANNAPDGVKVVPDSVVGTYVTKIPKVGPFFLFMQTPLGIFLCVVIPLLLVFAIMQISDAVRIKKLEKEFLASLEAKSAPVPSFEDSIPESEEVPGEDSPGGEETPNTEETPQPEKTESADTEVNASAGLKADALTDAEDVIPAEMEELKLPGEPAKPVAQEFAETL